MQKLLDEFRQAYSNKNYLKLSLYSLLALLTLLASTMLTYYIGVGIYSFIAMRFEALIAILGAYLLIYFWLREKRSKKEEQEKNILLQANAAQQSAEKALCESNYTIIRQCLFSTLAENASVLNLVKPERISELDSPSQTILKGNVYMCQFVVLKKGESDPQNIKEILQIRLAQKLNALEFAGITQTTYIHNGNAYPILCIDEVNDIGTYIQIDIAWASENYCNLLNARTQARFLNMQPQKSIITDRDF